MKQRFAGIGLVVIVALLLAACGPAAADATSTSTPFSPEMIQTAAAQTVIAQLTQQAALNTPTSLPTATFTSTPAGTITPLATLPNVGGISTPARSTCNSSTYISDVTITDGTLVAPNQEFIKTWRVSNTGTCAWTTSFNIVFSSGEKMGGGSTSLTKAVAPGEQIDVSVKLKAPSTTGSFTGVWILADGSGQTFPTVLTVVIKTGSVTASPTKSITVSPSKTSTSGVVPTSTWTPTNTIAVAPTETPTSTVAPTETVAPTSTTGT
jgi:hypothetical protein